MLNRILPLIAALFLFISPLACAADTLPLIPKPLLVERHDGTFKLADSTTVQVADDDAAARKAAEFLIQSLRTVDGPQLQLTSIDKNNPAIVFATDPKAPAGKESYSLDIGPEGVRVAARDAAGLVHGAATLWQLLTHSANVDSLPALHIEDAPRFSWRGLLLDSVRHMQTPAEIRKLINQMALHKLNVLHWHLTDDQGWRIEIKQYPKLTEVGAWRKPPNAGENGVPLQYGGYYTQEEIRALVRYAADRSIRIVPELDMPGHATAAIAAYPHLGVTDKPLAVSPDWGVFVNLYNVEDSTFEFLENVLDEVMELFPSTYIHLGGDEAVKDQWKASAKVQARMQQLGLENEEQLQGWFMGRVAKYLAEHGRRMIGWDEILGGKLPANAAVMSWRGTEGAIKAAQMGHDVVLSPAPQLYFDSLQSAREDETTGRVPVQSLADIYAFEPVPSTLDASEAEHVLGAQANVWTEHMPSFAHVQHAVFPRIAALAEVLWSPREQHDLDDFMTRIPDQLARYRRADIAYADSAFAPTISIDAARALEDGKTTVTLSNQADFGTLRYTVDGSKPGKSAPRYREPFDITLPATIRVATYDDEGRLLAKPRQRVIDRAQLLTRTSGELVNCPGSQFRLRVQPTPDATSMQPVYTLPLFNDCQVFAAAPLDGIAHIEFDIARLPNNYQLAHEAKLVVQRTPKSEHGELRVYLDGCEGKMLASLPLTDPATAPRTFTLQTPLVQHGRHDLCLAFAVPKNAPLYVFEQVTLVPKPKP